MLAELLLEKQNRDGGWSYRRGGSWTEPTVYAVLALVAHRQTGAAERGIEWLRRTQLADGGWPANAGLTDSAWVTSLAALLPLDILGAPAHARAVRWLLGNSGEETSAVNRLRQWLMGNPSLPENEFPGWPWIPGAAAWVSPTSLAILALDKERRRSTSPEVLNRIEEGHNFLVRRMCAGGGWNHGSVRALGYESSPYPETTGMALAALRGVRNQQVAQSLDAAKRFLAECRSADAYNWLRLGLLAHGQPLPGNGSREGIVCRTVADLALDAIVEATLQGQEVLWA